MPTRQPPRRLNSLPQVSQAKDDLGISIKGNDILKRGVGGCKSSPSHFKPPPPHPPQPSPRIRIVDGTLVVPQQPEQPVKVVKNDWRPASVVRRLVPGDITIPSIAESTADILELARSSRLRKEENSEVASIQSLFAGIVTGDIEVPPPDTRSVACSPLSNWSLMSEDLLEHVSQRVALKQQQPSRNSLGGSRPATSHVTGHVTSRAHSVSPGALSRPSSRASARPASVASLVRSERPKSSLSRPPTGSSSRKRPLSGRSSASSRPGTSRPASVRPASVRPASARPASRASRDLASYRESLSETGISLPSRTVERLVSSYEKDKLSRDSCSRMSSISMLSNESQQSSPLYNVIRQKVNQGYVDMVKAFEVYDKLGRGVLGRDDFKRVLKHFTVDLTKAQIENLLRRSDLVDDWNLDRIPYRTFLKKYMDRGRSGYVKHLNTTGRPQTGDTEFADIAEARLFAQLHSDFVDVLENFRNLDGEDTGCVPYRDFKNIMSEYGLKIPGPAHEDDVVNYVDYLNSVTQLPAETPSQSCTPTERVRPQTAPSSVSVALSHAYTVAEEDPEIQFQQLSLNLQPVHKDPRKKALVKLENCKILNGGTRRPVRVMSSPANSIQGQISRKFGSDTAGLRRILQHYDTQRDGNINIGTFRNLLDQFNIKVDDNDFYHVVNTFDASFKGVIPYREFLTTNPAY